MHTDVSLSKQAPTIVAGRRRMLKIIDVLGAYYTSGKAYGNSVLQATLPGEKALVHG